jgi:hypothetical protein
MIDKKTSILMLSFALALFSFLLIIPFSKSAIAKDSLNSYGPVSSCQARAVQYEDGEFKIQTYLYRPTAKKNRGQNILIMPPTGKTNFIDRSYADSFCRAGFQVFILDGWTGDDERSVEIEIHSRLYSRAHAAIRLLLDRIAGQGETGIFGTSVGATHAAAAVSDFPEIRAAFVVTGAASIAKVIANSDQDVLQEVRKKRFEIYGFKTQQEYIEALDRTISLDPLKMSRGFAGKALGMVIAKKDSTVPHENQQQLRDLWQPKEVIYFNAGHVWAIVKTWLFKQSQITEFFIKNMERS